jgi:putative transposase
MTALYPFFGITRQGAFAAWQRQEARATQIGLLAELTHCIRADHPRMGLRKIYAMLAPLPIGRDAFVQAMAAHGLLLERPCQPWVTTHAQHRVWHPNLLFGLVVHDMHQAWATDLTYFRIGDRFAYLIFLLDIYTRVILSAVASRTMLAEANIAALRQALIVRGTARRRYATIHHSDRGGQFIDAEYCAILREQRFRFSMCQHAYENAYVERVNGTIKNEYLYPRDITTFEALPEALAHAVHAYNTTRPHWSLPRAMPPAVFAASIASQRKAMRPKMVLYDSSADGTSPQPQCEAL